ncbi:DUF4421 domain-containing protein [Flavobacterium sp. Sd200]|uniref:DUF4421 family protein n=1 Tax=Flavobacterium sp. Sd200 TaxID=2692211 RepID=UPI001368A84E|nr:DUF4421 family protein [Flavobacterium sp. Sd200]MXN92746.1 DUF4421 domain-containing protein [Flavobacterium sp. Sd200]
MGIKRYIVSLLFVVGGCVAQTDSLGNDYIQKFPDKISVQAFLLNTSNEFTINYEQENIRVGLVPNQKTTLNIGVQYDIVSFSFGYAPKFFANNNDNGDSKMTAFSVTLFPGRFMQRLEFYYQKGISMESDNVQLIYFPELSTMKIGGSTTYIFNDNFSFGALSFQNERQLKSVGSFVPSLSYYYTELNGKRVEELGDKGYFIDVALSPGYNYNWVIAKKFLVAGGLSLGAGFSKTVDEGENFTSFLTQASLSISLGYNSETFYGGVYSKGTASNHKADSNAAMDDVISYVTAFFGYRFDAPSFLQKEKERIKSKL